MPLITREALAQSAAQGWGIEHLTPAQAWAAHMIGIPSERLQLPMESIVMDALADLERVAREKFFGGVAPDDADEMIRRAHDEQHPMFLRGPMLETLQEGMREFFPNLKPSVVDDEGRSLFNLSDLAQELGASEDELLALAEEKGFIDQLHTGNVNQIH